MTETIDIRPLHDLSEMRPAVDLQRIYWGEDAESVVAGHMLYSIVNAGGHVLGAYDGERLIGVLIGLVALDPDTSRPLPERVQIASKRMVVLPAYRSHGVGARLKLAQRQEAIRQGIKLVTWTFDPLLSTNAHLNIRKLRSTSRIYLPDYYGTDDKAGLTRLGASDRLFVEWWVDSPAVSRVLDEREALPTWADYLRCEVPVVNAAGHNGVGLPTPAGGLRLADGALLVLVEIPPNYTDLLAADVGLARAWQVHIRDVFVYLFAHGYVATDFIHTRQSGMERSLYVLTRSEPSEETA
jgi:predicted GNAT superfamily acetyltransferase